MASSVSLPSSQDPVLSQIARAARGTIAAVVGLALLAAAVVYGAAPLSDAWARVAGDPDLVLAEGVTLSAAPAALEVPAVRPLTVPEAEAALTGALGGPLQVVTDGESAGLGDPQRAEALRGLADGEALGLFASPAGLVVLTSDPDRGLRASVAEVRPGWAQVDEPGREAFVRTLVARAAVPGGPQASGAPDSATVIRDGSGASTVLLEDADALATGVGDRVSFDAAGRVTALELYLGRVVGTKQVAAVPAADAWERLRHHDGVWIAADEGPEVHSARLARDTHGRLWWEFLDVTRAPVALWSAGPAEVLSVP